ncbi:hypothetical protein NBRC116494_28540 [Aurantivibrio plasticivorans]
MSIAAGLHSRVFDTQAENDNADAGLRLNGEGRWSLNASTDIAFDVDALLTQRERRYVNARSLFAAYYQPTWDMRVGVDTVFWGVMEVNHLVDVINQTNYRESFHAEDKYGQPMFAANMLLAADTNIPLAVEWYLLPWTVEREFLDPEVRLGTKVVVDESEVAYESARGQQRLDHGGRVSQTLGIWNYAVSYFYGNTRSPTLRPLESMAGSATEYFPYYSVVRQVGIESQVTLDHVIYKLEAINVNTLDESYQAASVGFEYTHAGVFDSSIDVGYIMEYSIDDRDASQTVYQRDVFAGFRLAWNNMQSSELIAGINSDLETGSDVFRIQFDSRVGNQMALSLDAWLFMDVDRDDVIYALRDDSYIELELEYYF